MLTCALAAAFCIPFADDGRVAGARLVLCIAATLAALVFLRLPAISTGQRLVAVIVIVLCGGFVVLTLVVLILYAFVSSRFD
jgi:glucose-6-phosphate-specific signal transduction histidine kinase